MIKFFKIIPYPIINLHRGIKGERDIDHILGDKDNFFIRRH